MTGQDHAALILFLAVTFAFLLTYRPLMERAQRAAARRARDRALARMLGGSWIDTTTMQVIECDAIPKGTVLMGPAPRMWVEEEPLRIDGLVGFEDDMRRWRIEQDVRLSLAVTRPPDLGAFVKITGV